ncbi:MAG: YbjQ family protein [Pyrinomonadaceae bacterium MAG19_C2-C3]|nr:YbjQ family protein [Pyrinomonadaceae bacterium MAG19_C2-C3]
MDNVPLAKTAPYEVSQPRYSVSPQMVTTAFELPGYRVVQNLGVVRGIVVRSLSIIGTLGSTFRTLVGGNIIGFTRLCEQTRREAFEIMIQHATEINANAIIGARYDATEVMSGATEVLAYGTAVIVEPLDSQRIYYSVN